MREHLYKARRVNWRDMPKGEWWVEGYFVGQDYPECHVYIVRYINIEMDNRHIDILEKDIVEVEPATVCEYTGLTDREGRKIFEGDIVRRTDLHTTAEPSVGFIEYDNENTAFLIRWIDVEKYSATFPWKDRIKVCGNIFNNPEFLQEVAE